MNALHTSRQSSELRTSIRLQRREIPKIKQQLHAAAIIEQLLNSRLYHDSQYIALYLSTDGEVDISALIEQLFTDNKKVYLPVISPTRNGIMHFAAYQRETILEKNCFAILEPAYEERHLIPIEQLDLILAPLVCFDEFGNRMGMGGGYYDRALQHLKNREIKTQFFGIAHELQKVELLETHEWDIPLHGIITEKRLSYF